MKIARFDKASFEKNAEITKDGFIKGNVIVTRTGIFYYLNADGSYRKEYRPAQEVFNKDSLESLKMIPITNDHPKERLVTPENAKSVSIGFTGEQVQIQEPYILTNIVITDEKSIKEIRQDEKKELSLGYSIDLVEEPGEFEGERYDYIQTNIIYNHLSLVDQGRAGSEARISLDRLDAQEITKEEFMKQTKKDQEEMPAEGETMEQIKEKFAELEIKYKECLAEVERLKAERDSLKEQLEEMIEEYEEEGEYEFFDKKDAEKEKDKKSDKKNDKRADKREKFLKAVKARVKLEEAAKKLLDKETIQKMDSFSSLDLKKAIIKQRFPNALLDGQSEIYINGRYDGVLETIANHKESNNDVFLKTAGNDKASRSPETARNEMIERGLNAHKR